MRFSVRRALLAVGAIISLVALVVAIKLINELQEVDVKNASEETEQFAEKRQRPGETLDEWGCGLVHPSNDDLIRCTASYTSGRGYVLHFHRINDGEDLKLDRVEARKR